MSLSEVKGARNNNKNIHLNSKFRMSISECRVQIVDAVLDLGLKLNKGYHRYYILVIDILTMNITLLNESKDYINAVHVW